MAAAARALQLIVDTLFILLGVLATADWIKRRGAARAQLALAVGLLSLVIAGGLVARGLGLNSWLVGAALGILFIGSGYALIRFRDAHIPMSRRNLRLIGALNVASAVLYAASTPPPSGAPLSLLQTVAVILIVVVWIFDTGEPMIMFWRFSRRLPSVQRARLRFLALGYGGFILILLVALASGPLDKSTGFQFGSDVAALLLMPFLYAGIAPPQWLRRLWRAGEEAALRAAAFELVAFAPDAETFARRSLDWAMRLVGAEAGFFARADKTPLAVHGITEEEARTILDRVGHHTEHAYIREIETKPARVTVVVPIPSRLGPGYLGTISGPFTPIFGSEELTRLVQYGRAVAAGMDRVQSTTMIEMLQSIALAANESTDLLATSRHVIQAICDYTSWPIGHAVYPPDGVVIGSAHSSVWYRPDPPDKDWERLYDTLERRMANPEVIIGHVLKTGQTYHSPSVTDDERFRARADAATVGITSGLWVPIRSGAAVVGVLEFLWTAATPASTSVISAVETAAATLGRIFERARAMAHVQEANNAKSEYLSRISHELRTPLTVIIGYADILALRGREEDSSALRAIQNASSHLLGLVNDVLDISKVESHSEEIELEPMAVRLAIDQAIDLVEPIATMHDVVIKRHVSDKVPPILVNPQYLVQVLVNLLSNAVKYGGNADRIDVRAQVLGDRVRITVADHGPGIAPELIGRLFVPFERIGAERTTVSGSGLGLALVKRLAEAMGGAVGVVSTVGEGSEFWIDVYSTATNVTEIPGRSAAVTEAVESSSTESDRTVLFVDDNEETVTLAREIFALRPDLLLVVAKTGTEALQQIEKRKPQVVFLDIHLPDINGDEVLQRVKRNPNTAETPVIILSADATRAQIDRLMTLGATQYITKPVSLRDFLRVVDGVVKPWERIAKTS